MLVQPLALPRRIPKTIKNSAAANVTRPRTSVCRAPSSRDSGMRLRATANAKSPDRDIDEEDPAPAEPVGEDATDEGTAGNGGAYRCAPDRKRFETVRPAVLVTDESERRCEQRGAANPLERTRHVESRDAPGEAAEERGQREEQDPRDEDQAAPVPIRKCAGSEDQRGQAERIGVHDPLQARQAGIETLLHVRQRDHYDCYVEQEHERRQADGEKRPFPRLRG